MWHFVWGSGRVVKQLKRGGVRKDGILLGLYEGVPQTTWGKREWPLPPDKITIFQESIESYANMEDEVRELVWEVVWHEIAHHFGFDERGARRLDAKTKKEMWQAIGGCQRFCSAERVNKQMGMDYVL